MKLLRSAFSTLAALLLTGTLLTPALQAQDNGSAGEPIMASIDPSTLTYDYLVDGSLAADDPANFKFTTLQAAYAAAPAGTAARPTVIGIKPNVYLITGTASTPGLTISKNYITLLGLTNNRRSVVLADNRGNKQGGGSDTTSYNGYVIIVNATGFTAKNLTFLNYCNVDYEYPGDPSKNLSKRSDVITQAVALQSSGDKHIYQNVAILSRLDTMFLQTTRAYYKDVFIEGTDDFIGGGTISVWEDCVVSFPTGNGVPSMSGIVFLRTKFVSSGGMQFYKSAGSPVTLIDCVMPVNGPGAPVAWVRGNAPLRPNLYSLTYNVKDTNGNPAVITDGSTGPVTFNYSRELSAQEVLAFNPWNLLRASPTGVADDWDPAGVQSTYESLNQGNLIYRMAITGGSASIRTGGTGATIGATVSPARAPDKTITWSTDSTLISLSSSTGASVVVTGNNLTDEAQYVSVKASAVNGFYINGWVYVEPRYIAPPAVTQSPSLAAPANGFVTVNYALDLGDRQDQSVISWFTCDDASGSNPQPVAVSRGNLPLKDYPLTLGDVGKFLMATVQPKHNISDPGPAVSVVAATPVGVSDIKSPVVSPKFRNFIVAPNAQYVSGRWTVNGTWTSVTGDSLVEGYGVRVGSQGASILYQQDGKFGDMQLMLVMTPEKTAGQGFGSPGSPVDGDAIQKSDIYIKYDPRTKNGYALRYWRTTASAEKCMFQLYQIVNGVGSPASDQQVLTGVFKPNTYMLIRIVGSKFTVNAYNDSDAEVLALEGTITPNSYGGAGVYWSGSTPAGNSNVYSLFEISYPGAVQLVSTAKLTKLNDGTYQVAITVTNNGTGTAQNVQVNTAALGSVSGVSAPLSVDNLPPGASGTVTVVFPASVGASGTGTVEKYSGSYTGGSFNSTLRAVLP